jgi:predicted dehydrogenase
MVTLPSPRTPDPRSAPSVRWGILGPGWIAEQMVGALRANTQQQVVAVGSRDPGRAQAFAQRHGIPRGHGSYEALVSDPDVDIVYVASPHSGHREHALLALDAGKHVLIEKAFARNAAEARDIVDRAREQKLFCMEAMWTRFLPGTDVIRQCLEQDLLGPVEVVFADHGQPLHPNGPRRLSDPELAGGALLDLGIYPVSFASFALGGLSSVTAVGELAETGVDAREAMIVRGARGGTGLLHATMTARTETMASIVGPRGRLDIGERTQWLDAFYGPTVIRHQGRDEHEAADWLPEEDTSDPHHVGLHYEACEAARCIADGLTESPLLPLDETVAIMGILDDVRAQIGVRYPGE